jgi:hypothetical protein
MAREREGTEDADDLGVWRAGIAGAVVSAASSESVAAVAAEDDNGAFEELPALSASAFVENPSPGPSAPRPLSDLRGRGIEAADAVFAAGDFTGLFATTPEVGVSSSRNYRPRRRF